MRVLLISGNREAYGVMTPLPLSPACVAAATARAGFEVRFLDLLSTPNWKAATQSAMFTSEIFKRDDDDTSRVHLRRST